MKSVIVILFIQLVHIINGWVFTDITDPEVYLRKFEDLDRNVGDTNNIGFNDTESGKNNLKFSLIYPGTKWCGPGDVADNFEDLGSDWQADKCCRAHDYCPDTIPGGERKNNLTNEAFYTRLNCECDDTFRQCLRKANTYAALNIGKIYFNLIDTQCFRKDYPVKKCLKRGRWPVKKCLEYSYDTSAKKVYGWFDVPNF